MSARDDGLDDDVRDEACSIPGCFRITVNLFCEPHRRALAVLHDDERGPEFVSGPVRTAPEPRADRNLETHYEKKTEEKL